MNINFNTNELPLDNIAVDGGFTSIFRTVGFIGDSLSSGEHESLKNGIKGYHDFYEYSWGQYIARKCGLKAYNFSQGGLKAKDLYLIDNRTNLLSEENKCQAYVIALGVNDINNLNTYKDGFGTIDDVDFSNEDNNKDSFVGWYCKIIQKLRKLEPKSRIFVVTLPNEVSKNSEQTLYSIKHQEFLNSLDKYFKFIYSIDLRKYAPVYDDKFKDIYFTGGHMNSLGYKFTGDMIASYIDHIIRHNYKDFKQVAFIGRADDLHNESDIW